jgi:nuclear-control-of-ATPase protein 2
LITAPKKDEEMSDTDRGLLILGVSSMRSWAAGLAGGNRGVSAGVMVYWAELTDQAFLDDLRMVEDPVLSRGDKLRVVERIWRCWGVDGRRKV